MSRANVIIAVRDTDLRLSLDLMLRDEPYLNILGTASTPESTFGLTKVARPDLILLEWLLSSCPIEEMLKEIKDHSPNSKVILLGNSSNKEPLTRQYGVDAYLRIGGTPESLRSTIKKIIAKDSEIIQIKE
jgi:DNA-binding NarL/FixJ family response regulator